MEIFLFLGYRLPYNGKRRNYKILLFSETSALYRGLHISSSKGYSVTSLTVWMLSVSLLRLSIELLSISAMDAFWRSFSFSNNNNQFYLVAAIEENLNFLSYEESSRCFVFQLPDCYC
jgi:hypothetical protein